MVNIKEKSAGIARVLSSIFDEESRHFFVQKSAKFKRTGYYMSSRRPYRIQGINLFINRMPGIFQNPRSIGFALKLKRHTHGQPTKAVPEFSIDSKTIGEIISSTDMKS